MQRVEGTDLFTMISDFTREEEKEAARYHAMDDVEKEEYRREQIKREKEVEELLQELRKEPGFMEFKI